MGVDELVLCLCISMHTPEAVEFLFTTTPLLAGQSLMSDCVGVIGWKGGAQAGPQEGVTGHFITRWPTSHNDA